MIQRTFCIEEVLKLNQNSIFPILGIVYGSRNKDKDIDLFLIFKDKNVPKNIINSKFDLFQTEQNNFFFRLNNFDPEYTEPILTGEYLLGNNAIIEKSKEFLLNITIKKMSYFMN